MRRSVVRALRFGVSTLVISTYMALASTPNYGNAMLLIPFSLVLLEPVAERLDRRYRFYRHATNVVTIISALFLLRAGFWVGLLPAATWLVMFVQAHKMLHRKARRDYYQLFLMSFLLLVSACAQFPDAFIAVALVVFLGSMVWSALLLQVHSELEQCDDVNIADVDSGDVPEPLAKFHGQHFGGLGLLRCAVALGMAVLAGTALLFLGLPRMEAGFLGRTAPSSSVAASELSPSVELARGGRILADMTPVMRVEFPDEPGGQYSGPLYWRSTTFDNYMGGRWERLGLSTTSFWDNSPRIRHLSIMGGIVLARSGVRPGRVVRQVIYLDRPSGQNLPCLPFVVQIEGKEPGMRWDGHLDDTVTIRRSGIPSLEYEALSEVEAPPAEELRRAPQDYQNVLPPIDYANLTYHELQPRSVELAQRITAGLNNAYDKAVAIERWLKEGDLGYTDAPPTLTGGYPLDEFLHETRQGHCELFASAMALLLRSVGIPTRVVQGYRGGEWNEGDRSYLVLRSAAHLWVEVYIIDHGWIMFDPSPPETRLGQPLMGRLSMAWIRFSLRAKMFWYANVVGYRGLFQWDNLRDFAVAVFTLDFDALSQGRGILGGVARAPQRRGLLFIALFMVVAAAVLRYIVVRKQASRLVHYELSTDQVRAVRLFSTLKRVLRRLGMACSDMTAGEILAEVQRCPTLDAHAAANILSAYNEARFGGRPLSRAEANRLRSLARAVGKKAARRGTDAAPLL